MSVPKLNILIGKASKPEFHYLDLRISGKTVDSSGIACSTEYIAYPMDLAGGSLVGIIKLSDPGRKPPIIKLMGHTSSVQDIRFNPFYQSVVCTASEDASVRLWNVPSSIVGAELDVKESEAVFAEHVKRVVCIDWNNTSDFILASCSLDQFLKIWDVNKGLSICTMKFDDHLFCCSWNLLGDLVSTTCRNKNLYIVDPRLSETVASVECHEVNKIIKTCWVDGYAGVEKCLLTTGFTKNQERQVCIWDMRNFVKPAYSVEFDRAPNYLLPNYDESLAIIYLAAKGDTLIRCLQFRDMQLYKLEEYRGTTPAKTFGYVPKLVLETAHCEVGRFLKNEEQKTIVPISFSVPRKNVDNFHQDLYPPTLSNEAALSAEEWVSGKKAQPRRVSMNPADRMILAKEDKTLNFTTKRHSYCLQSPVNLTNESSDNFNNLQKMLAAQTESMKVLQQENNVLKNTCNELKNKLKLAEEKLNCSDDNSKNKIFEEKILSTESKLKAAEKKLQDFDAMKKRLHEMEEFIVEISNVCKDNS